MVKDCVIKRKIEMIKIQKNLKIKSLCIIKEKQNTKDFLFFVRVLMVDQVEPAEEVHFRLKRKKNGKT